MFLYWMPCGKALPEDAPVCLLRGSPVKSTEATHPHRPDTLFRMQTPQERLHRIMVSAKFPDNKQRMTRLGKHIAYIDLSSRHPTDPLHPTPTPPTRRP